MSEGVKIEASLTFQPTNSFHLQGDNSTWSKPSVDFKTRVPFWPGQARTGQTKAELLFQSHREVLHKLNGHPVVSLLVRNQVHVMSTKSSDTSSDPSSEANGALREDRLTLEVGTRTCMNGCT